MSIQKSIFSMKQENAKAIVIIVVVLVVLVLFVVYANKFLGGIGNVLRSVTDKLGITDSADTQARNKAIADATSQANTTGSPWNASYYKNAPAGASLLTSAYADDLCKQIWDSVNIFTANDGASCLSAIKQCSAKSQISFLSDRFQQKYNEDLYTYIVKNYTGSKYFIFSEDADIVTQINTYVNSLPNY